MRTAISHSLSPASFGLHSWNRSEERSVLEERARSTRKARPFLAALLMAAAVVLLVGGCLVAAWLGGILGIAAAMCGFAGYLSVFARSLSQLPVEWSSWRARKYDEYHEATDDGNDRIEGGRT
jgi:hypothetical protein